MLRLMVRSRTQLTLDESHANLFQSSTVMGPVGFAGRCLCHCGESFEFCSCHRWKETNSDSDCGSERKYCQQPYPTPRRPVPTPCRSCDAGCGGSAVKRRVAHRARHRPRHRHPLHVQVGAGRGGCAREREEQATTLIYCTRGRVPRAPYPKAVQAPKVTLKP